MKRLILITLIIAATAFPQTAGAPPDYALVLPISMLRQNAQAQEKYRWLFGPASPETDAYFRGKRDAYQELVELAEALKP